MKVIEISHEGIISPKSAIFKNKNNEEILYLYIGDQGRGRWQVNIPLDKNIFKNKSEADEKLKTSDKFVPIILHNEDKFNNKFFFLTEKPSAEKGFIVLWKIQMGYRGFAEYKIPENVQILAKGYIAQGDAGRMGSAPQFVLKVTSPCSLFWRRNGRLYGNPNTYIAHFDGENWTLETPETQSNFLNNF